MAIQLTTTSEAAKIHGVKCCVYGKAGMGKTTLCATAPYPVILSAEAGLLSLADYNIPVIQITTIQELMDSYQWATESSEAKDFQTICLDSISEIAEVVLANAKEQVRDPRQAYGELIEKMGKTLRSFRDLSGKHVYFSAKQEAIKDDATGVVSYGPSMPGSKLGPSIPYMFDELFNLGVANDQDGQQYRYLQTQPTISAEAKDRSGKLLPVEYPHLLAVFNKILGGVYKGDECPSGLPS